MLRIALGMPQHHGERQAHVGDKRERPPRIHRQRRENRKDVFSEVGLQLLLLIGRQRVVVAHRQPDVVLEGRGQLVAPGRPQRAVERLNGLGDEGQLFLGCASVRRERGHVRRGLPLEATDPLAHKAVEVGGGDTEEAHPFEQGRARVLGDVEDAPVVVEPAQLAVEEEARMVELRLGRDRLRGHCTGQTLHVDGRHAVAAARNGTGLMKGGRIGDRTRSGHGAWRGSREGMWTPFLTASGGQWIPWERE